MTTASSVRSTITSTTTTTTTAATAASSSASVQSPAFAANPSTATSSTAAGPGATEMSKAPPSAHAVPLGSNTELRAQLRRERAAAAAAAAASAAAGGPSAPASVTNASHASSSSMSHTAFVAASATSHHHSSHVHASQHSSSSITAGHVGPSSSTMLELRDRKARDLSDASVSSGKAGETSPAAASATSGQGERHRGAMYGAGMRQQRSREDGLGKAHLAQAPEAWDNSYGLESLQAAFSQKFYELANKCKSWERYAGKIRAQAESLEGENRLLRELNAKQEGQIAGLEVETISLREALGRIERERRRLESKLATLEDRLSMRSQSSGDMASRYRAPSRAGDGLDLDAIQAPSPPRYTGSHHGHHGADAAERSFAASTTMPLNQSIPFHSSNLLRDDEDEDELRPPTPMGNISLPGLGIDVIRPGSRGPGAKSSAGSFHEVRETTHHNQYGHHKRDSMADIIVADAAHREHGALYGEGRASRLGSRSHDIAMESSGTQTRVEDSESYTGRFHHVQQQQQLPHQPPRTVLPSSASFPGNAPLTAQALETLSTTHSMRTSSSQSSSLRAPSHGPAQRMTVSPSRVAKRQPGVEGPPPVSSNATAATAAAPKRRSTNGLGDLGMPNGTTSSASMPNLHLLGHEGAEGMAATSRGASRGRSSSAMSDTGTVRGEMNLQTTVEQRRQLRRISLTQQQQLLALQAHDRNSAGAGTEPPSRPGSRLSNGGHGERTRSRAGRSRAGSSSVHDAIPIAKDDVFSDGGSIAPSTSSRALAQNDRALNSASSQSDVGVPVTATVKPSRSHHGQQSSFASSSSCDGGDDEFGIVTDGENTDTGGATTGRETPSPEASKQQQQRSSAGQGSATRLQQHMRAPSSSVVQSDADSSAEVDKRGAHRRLYMRLREELNAADLAKFERYVHRYDALEIQLDGPKGLVNRVKKLLLISDPTIRERPEQLKIRKALAREFESIVRVDLE